MGQYPTVAYKVTAMGKKCHLEPQPLEIHMGIKTLRVQNHQEQMLFTWLGILATQTWVIWASMLKHSHRDGIQEGKEPTMATNTHQM